MDQTLIAWARQVKSRRRWQGADGPAVPVLWLFSDPVRLPDPRPAARRLPPGLCGVVLRFAAPSADPVRLALARELAGICRARRLALQVAGDPQLAARIGAGVHLRRGRVVPGIGRRRLTSSAHDAVELRRAARAGAVAIFLSPCFPTRSHPGTRLLGARRWAALARKSRRPVLALGGISGARTRALPAWCQGAGAIEALAANA